MNKPTTLYKLFYCGGYGEADAFFTISPAKKIELFYWWCCNDATYRSEYMDPLFAKVGITMKPVPENLKKIATKLIEQELNA